MSKCLPSEPTESMINNASNAAWAEGMYIHEDILRSIYKAMWDTGPVVKRKPGTKLFQDSTRAIEKAHEMGD